MINEFKSLKQEDERKLVHFKVILILSNFMK